MDAIPATDWIIFALVIGARFLVPLLIPRYPLGGVIACLLIDAVDQTIFQVFTSLPLDGYQSYDKALDIYYLAIAYLSTLRNWQNVNAFRVSRFLFYYRLAGVALFEVIGWRPLLLIFPNTFEYFFIWFEALRIWRDPRGVRMPVLVSAAAFIWIVIKLPQEYWIHIAQLDVTDLLKTAVFNVPPETPWGHIFRAVPWLFIGVAVLAVAAIVVLVWLAGRRLPARAYVGPRPQLTPEGWSRAVVLKSMRGLGPSAAAMRSAREAWASRVVDRDLVEKLALSGLLTVIFAHMLPNVPGDSVPMVAVAAVGVVTVTTLVSHALVRRGVTWANALAQFVVMTGTNAAVVLLIRLLPGSPHLQLGASLFFIVLLGVIVTLFDRFQIVQRARGMGRIGPDESGIQRDDFIVTNS